VRVLAGLLVAGFVILVGACPSVASFVGSLLWAVFGLGLHGAAALLAQTAVQLLLAVWLGVHLYRNRRIA
jgi:hypothetical protein